MGDTQRLSLNLIEFIPYKNKRSYFLLIDRLFFKYFCCSVFHLGDLRPICSVTFLSFTITKGFSGVNESHPSSFLNP